ncbi:MAG: glycine betaine ABC transporter substrate-binding protein [Dehalococcoidales bacterium]|nr:glycine betaine ABC transporter substrate-binding protein [Dehalococcoidales bacterium]
MRFSYLKIGVMLLVGLSLLFTLTIGACAGPGAEEKPTINIAEGNWTSSLVVARIFDLIIGNQLGYRTTRTYAYGPIAWAGMDRGEFDLAPEIWYPARRGEIQPFLDKGTAELAGEIFGGAGNWWVVPRYVVEGDPERGIEPMAPDLKTVTDVAKYWELFENPENPGKGEIVGGEVGWANEAPWMILGYDLPFYLSNQSEAVMMARTIAADKRGKPILVTWWSPHIIFSQVDLIKLQSVDPDRTGEIDLDKDPYPLKTGTAEYTVYKVVRPGLAEKAPDVYRLVHNLTLTEEEINDLTYRVDVGEEEIDVVVQEWINEHQSEIDQWIK